MAWTEERVKLLTEHFNAGLAAAQIAEKLDVSRNAVIGKLYRLNLSKRKAAEVADKTKTTKKAAPKPRPSKKAAATTAKGRIQVAETPHAPQPEPAEEPASDKCETTQRLRDQPDPAEQSRGVEPERGPAAEQEESSDPAAQVRDAENSALKLSLLELTEKTCRWPIGDPSTEEFWFCGLPSAPGKPYCEAHISLAFQPLASRRERRTGR